MPVVVADATFGSLLVSHQRVMYRFAATLVPRSDIADLVQDALARAWTKRHQFDGDRGPVQSWLLAIVADQARSRWQRRQLLALVRLPDDIDEGPSATRIDLRRAVDALPPRQRTAIVLKHYVDLPIDQIATLMQCSTGTVKSTLHDARKNLSSRLGGSYGHD